MDLGAWQRYCHDAVQALRLGGDASVASVACTPLAGDELTVNVETTFDNGARSAARVTVPSWDDEMREALERHVRAAFEWTLNAELPRCELH